MFVEVLQRLSLFSGGGACTAAALQSLRLFSAGLERVRQRAGCGTSVLSMSVRLDLQLLALSLLNSVLQRLSLFSRRTPVAESVQPRRCMWSCSAPAAETVQRRLAVREPLWTLVLALSLFNASLQQLKE